MSRLTPALIKRRFPRPRIGTPRYETVLPDHTSQRWRREFLTEAVREGADVWVFSYGSLLWSGEIETRECRVARVHGWHRRFCLLQWAWRGDAEQPCLMLALDRGGSCEGMVQRFPGPHASDVLGQIWDREMSGDGYRPRWVTARTEAGRVRALTFVINRDSMRYSGRLSDADTARCIAAACGQSGACAEYLRRTLRALEDSGLTDHHLARLEQLVATELEAHHERS